MVLIASEASTKYFGSEFVCERKQGEIVLFFKWRYDCLINESIVKYEKIKLV